ncbi:MAG: hypothetical protein NVSMB14_05080 [Isosphaeraceae bacterium]
MTPMKSNKLETLSFNAWTEPWIDVVRSDGEDRCSIRRCLEDRNVLAVDDAYPARWFAAIQILILTAEHIRWWTADKKGEFPRELRESEIYRIGFSKEILDAYERENHRWYDACDPESPFMQHRNLKELNQKIDGESARKTMATPSATKSTETRVANRHGIRIDQTDEEPMRLSEWFGTFLGWRAVGKGVNNFKGGFSQNHKSVPRIFPHGSTVIETIALNLEKQSEIMNEDRSWRWPFSLEVPELIGYQDGMTSLQALSASPYPMRLETELDCGDVVIRAIRVWKNKTSRKTTSQESAGDDDGSNPEESAAKADPDSKDGMLFERRAALYIRKNPKKGGRQAIELAKAPRFKSYDAGFKSTLMVWSSLAGRNRRLGVPVAPIISDAAEISRSSPEGAISVKWLDYNWELTGYTRLILRSHSLDSRTRFDIDGRVEDRETGRRRRADRSAAKMAAIVETIDLESALEVLSYDGRTKGVEKIEALDREIRNAEFREHLSQFYRRCEVGLGRSMILIIGDEDRESRVIEAFATRVAADAYECLRKATYVVVFGPTHRLDSTQGSESVSRRLTRSHKMLRNNVASAKKGIR